MTINFQDVAEIKHSVLEQSAVRSVGIQRKFHLPCKQTTAGRALIHLTLRAHPWPTHVFTCVSGLYLSSDFLSRDNDNLGTLFRIVRKNILSTLKLAFEGTDTTGSDFERHPLA